MPQEKEVHIATHVKTVEWLKTEIVEGVSSLFHGLYKMEEDRILEAMVQMILMNYLLARKLGIPFYQLEQGVLDKLKDLSEEGQDSAVMQELALGKDLSLLEEYLSKR